MRPVPERTRRSVRALVTGVLIVVGVVCLAGCSGDSDAGADDAEDAGFVGTVEGTDAFVGLVVATDTAAGADEALVYVCDGEEGIREWFKSAVDDPRSFTLINDGGGTVTAELADGTWSGHVTFADGSTHGFTTVRAGGDGHGGAGISAAARSDSWHSPGCSRPAPTSFRSPAPGAVLISRRMSRLPICG